MAEGRVCCAQFWLRRLHSLTGFLFLGYFLTLHVQGEYVVFNSTAFKVLFLYAPLLFHGLYGLFIVYESRPNPVRYAWVRNWMYFAQRITGVLLLVFIPTHLGAVKGWGDYLGAGWYVGFWYLGVVAAVFHLANGIFGTAIDWGITVGPHSQRVFVGVSFAAFFLLCGYGLYTLYTF